MPHISVTGSLAYDYISSYERPFSEVLLPDKLDSLSVCFLVKHKERHFGGTGGNIAYSLAILESPPCLVAAVGYDFEAYRHLLEGLGVRLDCLREFPDTPTASATIITDPKGNQIAEFHPGAMSAKGDIDATECFKRADMVIIAPDDTRRVMQYVQAAHELKTPYFFDPGQNLPIFTKEELLEAIDHAEGVFANDYELGLLKSKTGLDEDELLEKAKLLIVTLGEKGSIILRKHDHQVDRIEIPIAPPKRVKDPTGCGDGYRAGFLKGYVEKKPLEICGRMGSLMATYIVEKMGTQGHSLSWDSFVERYAEVFGTTL